MEFLVREQPFDYEWRIGGQDWNTIRLWKHTLRDELTGLTQDEVFMTLREGTAPSDLPVIEAWATDLNLPQIVDIIRQVKASYDRPFTVFFSYDGLDSNQATITPFERADRSRLYHIEYTLPGLGRKAITDSILRLMRNPFGDWETDSNQGNYLLYTPIGAAIARKENLPPLTPDPDGV
jgi:hypothetical protein